MTLRELIPLFDVGNQLSVRDNDGNIVFCANPDDGTLDFSDCGYLDSEITKIVPRAHHLIVYADIPKGKTCR